MNEDTGALIREARSWPAMPEPTFAWAEAEKLITRLADALEFVETERDHLAEKVGEMAARANKRGA